MTVANSASVRPGLDTSANPNRRQFFSLLGAGVCSFSLAVLLNAEPAAAKKKRRKNRGGKHRDDDRKDDDNNDTDNGDSGKDDDGNIDNMLRPEEAALLRLINDFRGQNGMAALASQHQLNAAALGHSQDMAARGYMAHTTPEGVTVEQRIANAGYRANWRGENIYHSDPRDTSALAAFTWWQGSPNHRANMLNGNYTHIGIGQAFDSSGAALWTNNFGSPAT